ncbi:DUF6492 family protein [Leifsonia sp. YIM 134122]|uniref:DUF6492 family protein n=1 Tax=Leifsonia stereocauli TaxID=3134136 RepID=A0ABU9WAX0_9MICO
MVTSPPHDLRAGTFVGVVFESEFALQRLQARSMARHLPADEVERVIVIDNSATGMTDAERSRLTAEYGVHAPVVSVLRPADITALPSASGWRAQQVLKLAVAASIPGRRYVVLDAKNHFVRSPAADFFVAADGRPRGRAHSYRDHPLRHDLERVLAYCGLDADAHLDRFTATITPVVLDADAVTGMIAGIEERSGRTFAREFVGRELTEFFLYSSWLLSHGTTLDEAFSLDQPSSPNIWPSTAQSGPVQAAIEAADEATAPLFSIHRTALANLDPEPTALLCSFWVRSGLFEDLAEAEAFVTGFRADFERARHGRRLRELPPRVLAVARRTARSVARRLPGRTGPAV